MAGGESFSGLLIFALTVTGPIFFVVLLGFALKKYQVIDDAFVSTASKLVFNVALPATLFIGVVKTDIRQYDNFNYIFASAIATIVIFSLSWFLAARQCQDKAETGIVVQGAFRGNVAIIGLAFCHNAYGESGLVTAALAIAVLAVMYNVLSIIILTHSLSEGRSLSVMSLLMELVKNPLIISILLGFIVVYANINMPKLVLDTGKYFAQMTLPLALLCVGGAMNLSVLKGASGSVFSGVMLATLIKLVLAPVVSVVIAMLMGIREQELGVVFLLAASPTATISFVMVQAMRGDGVQAANIIVLTTLGAIFSVTGGLFLLVWSGVI